MQKRVEERSLVWWKRCRVMFILFGLAMALFIVVQLFFPNNALPLFAKIGGIELGGWDKAQATIALDRAYNAANIEIYLGDSEKPHRETKPADLGLKISNQRRVGKMGYPWYIRLVPTSLLWWGLIAPESEPNFDYDDLVLNRYIEEAFGKKCQIEPVNASLAISGESIHLTTSSVGGRCNTGLVREELKTVDFLTAERGQVRISVDEQQPEITSQAALDLANRVSKNMLNDLELSFEDYDDTVFLRHEDLISWIGFEVAAGRLTVVIDEAKSAEFYRTEVAPLVETAAGVTTITTSDLEGATRENGAEGKVVNIKETNLRIAEYLMDERKTVAVAVESIDPSIQYVYERPQAGRSAEQEPAESTDSNAEIEIIDDEANETEETDQPENPEN